MIADGALDDISLFILPCPIYTDNDTLDRIRKWVENGGILLCAGKVTDLELNDNKEFDEMLGFTEDTDYCEGLTTFEVQEGVPFKTFFEQKTSFSEVGYNNLSADTKLITLRKGYECPGYSNMNTCDVTNAFYRQHGRGMAISYFGILKFEFDPQAIFKEGDFAYLLDDVLSNYAKDLRTDDGEVVRGEIDGEIYALMENGAIKKVQFYLYNNERENQVRKITYKSNKRRQK